MILMCVITCTGCYHQNRLFGCSFVTPVLLMVVFMVVLVLSVVRIGVVLVQYSWLALLVVSLVVWYDMLVICWLYMSIVWWTWLALVVLGLVDVVVLVIVLHMSVVCEQWTLVFIGLSLYTWELYCLQYIFWTWRLSIVQWTRLALLALVVLDRQVWVCDPAPPFLAISKIDDLSTLKWRWQWL